MPLQVLCHRSRSPEFAWRAEADHHFSVLNFFDPHSSEHTGLAAEVFHGMMRCGGGMPATVVFQDMREIMNTRKDCKVLVTCRSGKHRSVAWAMFLAYYAGICFDFEACIE